MSESSTMTLVRESLDDLLASLAADTERHQTMEQRLADAEQRLIAMERDAAEAMEQLQLSAEPRLQAERETAHQQGRLVERDWVLGLIGHLLDGLIGEGTNSQALRTLRSMVEVGP
ncbi:MAG: hypothetical protein KGO47_08600 [Cyanobacteria bacterium REEB417]|nr:hypothetical protein [Cyanobacteria bacterium REEB417]